MLEFQIAFLPYDSRINLNLFVLIIITASLSSKCPFDFYGNAPSGLFLRDHSQAVLRCLGKKKCLCPHLWMNNVCVSILGYDKNIKNLLAPGKEDQRWQESFRLKFLIESWLKKEPKENKTATKC